jgi:hypothetical protein
MLYTDVVVFLVSSNQQVVRSNRTGGDFTYT